MSQATIPNQPEIQTAIIRTLMLGGKSQHETLVRCFPAFPDQDAETQEAIRNAFNSALDRLVLDKIVKKTPPPAAPETENPDWLSMGERGAPRQGAVEAN